MLLKGRIIIQQLISVLVAFAALLLLTQKFKLSSSTALIVTGILINIFAQVEPANAFNAVVAVFTTYNSVHTIICVILLGILSNMLIEYGFLRQIVVLLKRLVHNKKLLIGSIPMVLGIMSVPGGAYMSAPFVDELGNDLDIDKPKRAAINLTYRHATVFFYPFSANLILIAALVADYFNIYSIIRLNLAFSVLLLVISSWLFFPRPNAKASSNEEKSDVKLSKDLKMLAFYAMPIYFVVFVNILPGVIPAAALLVSILLTCFLCDRKNLSQILLKGINKNMILTVAGVFFIQNTIRNLDNFIDLFFIMLNSQSDFIILIGLAAGCFFVGLISGISLVPASIFIPILLTLPLNNTELLILVFFAWSWSFMGYFYSPVHLCQILTVQSIGVSTSALYKEIMKLFPFLAAGTFTFYFIYRFILL